MRRAVEFAAVALLATSLGACGILSGAASSVVSVVANDGPADVAAAEVALTTVERLVVRYEQLPSCGSTGATGLCADPTIVAEIKTADAKAFNAVMAAKKTLAAGDVQVALSAISALQSLVPNISGAN
ncbi:MAG TPA: hypothetical protein VIJ42_09275 [Stellaceae bacterium]